MSITITRESIEELEIHRRVAFEVRCALRLRDLFCLPAGTPNGKHHENILDQVLKVAREFAEELDSDSSEIRAEAKETTAVYARLAELAWMLSLRKSPDKNLYEGYQSISVAYQAARNYLTFAVAADEIETLDDWVDSAYYSYEDCAIKWGFKKEALRVASSEYAELVEHQQRFRNYPLPEPVPGKILSREPWPDGKPANWSEVIEHHRIMAGLLSSHVSKQVLDVFDGFVERIDGDVAYVSLKNVRGGNTLYGHYSARDLDAKGIGERRRFRCVTLQAERGVTIELERISEKTVTKEREEEIRREVEEALGGKEIDD